MITDSITAAGDYADKRLIQYGLIDPETLEFKSKDGDGYAIWLECCSAFLAGAKWREEQNRALGLKLSRELKIKSSFLLSRALLCLKVLLSCLIGWQVKLETTLKDKQMKTSKEEKDVDYYLHKTEIVSKYAIIISIISIIIGLIVKSL